MQIIKTLLDILATLSLVSLGYGVLVFMAGSASADPRKQADYRSAGGLLIIASITAFAGSIVLVFR